MSAEPVEALRHPARGELGRHSVVFVLAEDPDLAEAVPPEQRGLATRRAVAPLVCVEPGPWDFQPAPESGAFGALVLSGLAAIRVELQRKAHVELITSGDVVAPWLDGEHSATVPYVVAARAITPLRLAYLDRRFALATAPVPQIAAGLIARLVQRSRRHGLQAAINALPRLVERVELTLWALADRVGRVTNEGVVLELPLTHRELAELVGAARPSVTKALSELVAAGSLLTPERGFWTLTGERPGMFEEVEATSA